MILDWAYRFPGPEFSQRGLRRIGEPLKFRPSPYIGTEPIRKEKRKERIGYLAHGGAYIGFWGPLAGSWRLEVLLPK